MGRRRIKLSTTLIHGPLVAIAQGLVKVALDGGGPRRKPAVEPEPPKPAQAAEPLPPATPAQQEAIVLLLGSAPLTVVAVVFGSWSQALICIAIVCGLVGPMYWRRARPVFWACIVLCAIAVALLLAVETSWP